MESTLPGQAAAPLDSVIWIGSILFVVVLVFLFFLWLRKVRKK